MPRGLTIHQKVAVATNAPGRNIKSKKAANFARTKQFLRLRAKIANEKVVAENKKNRMKLEERLLSATLAIYSKGIATCSKTSGLASLAADQLQEVNAGIRGM
jgi:hypothetical protein